MCYPVIKCVNLYIYGILNEFKKSLQVGLKFFGTLLAMGKM